MAFFERYKLILRHEAMDFDGTTCDIEPPRVLSYTVDHNTALDSASRAVFLNDMLERFKMDILEMESRGGG